MPEVRYVGGATYALRNGPTWADGDVYEVDEETAARLCDDWRFERVNQQGADEDGDVLVNDGDDGYEDASDEDLVTDGRCPWCPPDDRYEGDHVGQHASSAHPDEWADYQEG